MSRTHADHSSDNQSILQHRNKTQRPKVNTNLYQPDRDVMSSRASMQRPSSPIDNTPITINGRTINRNDYKLGAMRRAPASLRIVNEQINDDAPLDTSIDPPRRDNPNMSTTAMANRKASSRNVSNRYSQSRTVRSSRGLRARQRAREILSARPPPIQYDNRSPYAVRAPPTTRWPHDARKYHENIERYNASVLPEVRAPPTVKVTSLQPARVGIPLSSSPVFNAHPTYNRSSTSGTIPADYSNPVVKLPESKSSNITRREPTRREPTRKEPTKREPTKREPTKREPTKREPTKREPTRREPTRREPTRREPTKKEFVERLSPEELAKNEFTTRESVKRESAIKESVKRESPKLSSISNEEIDSQSVVSPTRGAPELESIDTPPNSDAVLIQPANQPRIVRTQNARMPQNARMSQEQTDLRNVSFKDDSRMPYNSRAPYDIPTPYDIRAPYGVPIDLRHAYANRIPVNRNFGGYSPEYYQHEYYPRPPEPSYHSRADYRRLHYLPGYGYGPPNEYWDEPPSGFIEYDRNDEDVRRERYSEEYEEEGYFVPLDGSNMSQSEDYELQQEYAFPMPTPPSLGNETEDQNEDSIDEPLVNPFSRTEQDGQDEVPPPASQIPATVPASIVGKTIILPGNMPDYVNMSQCDKAAYRAYFQAMFGRMRALHSSYQIDNISNMSLIEIHAYYDVLYKHFSIRSTVQYYMLIITSSWLGIELLFTKAFGLNFSGFTLNQLKMIPTYEKWMFEFAEKYSGVGSSMSPEVKIIGLTIVSAVIYLLLRVFTKYIGANLAGLIQSTINKFFNGEISLTASMQDLNGRINQDQSNPNATPRPGAIPPIPDAGGINIGGFDLSSLAGIAASMVGQFTNNQGRSNSQSRNRTPRNRTARRRPPYVD